MLDSSKFDCPILIEHNLIHWQRILMKFSENCQNIFVYWPVQFYFIIYKFDCFNTKTKRVSVQLGHSVVMVSDYFYFFLYRMAAILEFCIKKKNKRQIKIWFGILVIEFIEKKIYYYYFGMVMEAKICIYIKGPNKSNQASNLTSQRMVTESRFMILLKCCCFVPSN